MVLQIEQPEALRLVEKLSDLTGETAETIVAVALRERLDRLEPMDEAELQDALRSMRS